MRSFRRSLSIAATLVAVGAVPLSAQKPASLTADLLNDVKQVEEKLIGLARAIPAEKYNWRPGQGVRSVGELMLHVAADNYLIPAAAGTPAPASTGVKGDDYKTALAFEGRKLDRDATIKELEASFAFVKGALSGTPEANLGKGVKMFGQQFTTQQVWILATTHLHEHLGQAIAYARSNNVVPPWSK